ncbi:MAG: LysR family transcriptional regulator [Myxococcota bacterium]
MDHFAVLRAFVRLVELETFTAVAKELHVKQSTISKWMATLEEDLGVRLIDRTTRVLRVTPSGHAFYRRAASLVGEYDDAVAEVRDEATSLRGRIRISIPVVFGSRFIVPLMADFLHEHPDLELEVHMGDHYVNLVEHALDVAVRIGIPVDSSLQSHHLGDSRRRLVAAPTYLAERGTPSSPVSLEAHQCITHTELDDRTLWSFSRADETVRINVRGRLAVNHSASTLELTEAGLGIALLADWLVDPVIEAGRLLPLLEDYEPPPAPIRALTPPGRFVPARVRALIDHLRAGLPLRLALPYS